jgi:hypothetical protein
MGFGIFVEAVFFPMGKCRFLWESACKPALLLLSRKNRQHLKSFCKHSFADYPEQCTR